MWIIYSLSGSRQSLQILTPQEFVDQYIIGLNVMHVVAGYDYSYGRLGKGYDGNPAIPFPGYVRVHDHFEADRC